jgi:hypothetical protein
MMIAMVPVKKVGMEKPTIEKKVAPWSITEYCL